MRRTSARHARHATWIAPALLLAACGEVGGAATPDEPPAASGEIAPWCDDVEPLEVVFPDDVAPPSTTGEPDDEGHLAGSPQDPMAWTADVEAWGQGEAAESYAGMWLVDGRRMAVAFTGDVDYWAQELHELFHPGFGIAVAENTQAELLAVQDEIFDNEMPQDGWDGDEPPPGTIVTSGQGVVTNRTSVGVFEPDDARLAELSERYGAHLLCFEDRDVPQRFGG